MALFPWSIISDAQWSWVEASGLYIPKYFSFEELTYTRDYPELLEANREEAKAFTKPLLKLVENYLDPVRERYGSTFANSGFRGRKLNNRVGGSTTSQHCFGEAVDFVVKSHDTREGRIEVIKWLTDDCKKRGVDWGQMLLEGGCIHVSLPGSSSKNVVGWWEPGKGVSPIPELQEATA